MYLAEGIKGYPKVAENLLYALYKEGIETEYLPHSKSKKHVWARDYMPIQLEEGRFLKYVYRPDYLKNDKDFKAGEKVDIAGGRIMTFGICGLNANRVSHVDDKLDSERHYLDLNMTFNNGMDSTFVFDVTDQVRKRYKGGVITIELDVDTVPIPRRKGGSGFNAVVKDYEDGGTWEFPM